MEDAKISDFYDPMELSNRLVQIREEIKDNPRIAFMHENAISLSKNIMGFIGKNPEANRGAAILSASIMTLLSEAAFMFDDEEEQSIFSLELVTVGLPALFMSILTSESIVDAKNTLEGIPDYGF